MKILLADNRPAVRSALRLAFEIRYPDCSIEEVADLKAILFAIELDCPDILLLDWEMQPEPSDEALPNVCWENIVAAIRRKCDRIRIIVMSSDPLVRNNALAAGANAFLCKADAPTKFLEVFSQEMEPLSPSLEPH